MRVHILGSGGYFPNERRHTACYFLPESAAALDAGSGAFRLLRRIETEELDVFLSHAHLDHVVGLTYLLLPLATGQLARVRLHGTARTLEAVKVHLFSEALFPVLPPFEFRPLEAVTCVELADGGLLTHHPLKHHPGGTTAYRIDWPPRGTEAARSFAYVTDTIVDGAYTEFIRGVDVLAHECYFPDEQATWAEKTGHSHTSAVARLAAEADVGTLYLIHIDPMSETDDSLGVDAARALFPRITLAEDLQEIVLGGAWPVD